MTTYVQYGGLQFEWDPAKAKRNQLKHGVRFEEAVTVFADDAGVLIDDPDHSITEDRLILLGLSAGLRVLVVCHAYSKDEELIRIISARRATRKERTRYGERRRQ